MLPLSQLHNINLYQLNQSGHHSGKVHTVIFVNRNVSQWLPIRLENELGSPAVYYASYCQFVIAYHFDATHAKTYTIIVVNATKG